MFFGIGVGVFALYFVASLALGAVIAYVIDPGPWNRHAWTAATVVVATVGGLVAVVVGVFVGLAVWRLSQRRAWSLLRANRPTTEQMHQVRPTLEAFATAYGVSAPGVHVIAGVAPNALVFGSAMSGRVCFTTGAFSLPAEELTALCECQVSAIASPTREAVVAAIDATLIAEWWTRVVWTTAIVGFVVGVVGGGPKVGAAYLVGTLALVAVTRFALSVADRVLPELLSDVGALLDLETVHRSADPEALAELLLHLLEDGRRVQSRWEIAHRWFEPDALEIHRAEYGAFSQLADLVTGAVGVPPLVKRWARSSGNGLVERATIAVNLAQGDHQLRDRLARAARTSER